MKYFLTFVVIVAVHTALNASDCIDPFDNNGTCGNPVVWVKG